MTPIHLNIRANDEHEQDNIRKVLEHAEVLAQVPTVKEVAIMPDACPAGQAPGTIPVGGVARSSSIHPGMHSADVCCSMAFSNFGKVNPLEILNWAGAVTHFGVGGRPPARQLPPEPWLLEEFDSNPFLRDLIPDAIAHHATQGDGNHFLYVGTLKSTGETVMVTHHGSRKPGAMLYKKGMEVAEKYTYNLVGNSVPKHNSWINPLSKEGDWYWDALQIIRHWTKSSHFAIHDMVADLADVKVIDRFWNEHNFVFRRSDGDYYHAKGATPSFAGFSPDDDGRTLIPMNCAEPILIAAHLDNPKGLGFAPHGAGRNFSRKQHLLSIGDRSPEEVFKEETKGLDIRAYNGIVDLSELPSAYKNAETVRDQITEFGLANVTDEVLPFGSIMAGDAPWRTKKKKKAGNNE